MMAQTYYFSTCEVRVRQRLARGDWQEFKTTTLGYMESLGSGGVQETLPPKQISVTQHSCLGSQGLGVRLPEKVPGTCLCCGLVVFLCKQDQRKNLTRGFWNKNG